MKQTVDDLLQGTKYAGATPGDWSNSYTSVVASSVKICNLQYGVALPMKQANVNGKLIADAKRNAALAQLIGPLVEALEKACPYVIPGTENDAWVRMTLNSARTVMAIVDGENQQGGGV